MHLRTGEGISIKLGQSMYHDEIMRVEVYRSMSQSAIPVLSYFPSYNFLGHSQNGVFMCNCFTECHVGEISSRSDFVASLDGTAKTWGGKAQMELQGN